MVQDVQVTSIRYAHIYKQSKKKPNYTSLLFLENFGEQTVLYF